MLDIVIDIGGTFTADGNILLPLDEQQVLPAVQTLQQQYGLQSLTAGNLLLHPVSR